MPCPAALSIEGRPMRSLPRLMAGWRLCSPRLSAHRGYLLTAAICSPWADDVLALAAQLIDAELDDVARLQPHRRGEPHPDAGRRSGVDEVARLEDQELAQVVHDEVRVEDHVRGRAGLPPDAVDVEPHAQRQDVADLVRGDQPRAGRVEGLGRLALAPLTAPLHLERPLAHVVDDQEAGDRVPGLGGGVQVAAEAPD